VNTVTPKKDDILTNVQTSPVTPDGVGVLVQATNEPIPQHGLPNFPPTQELDRGDIQMLELAVRKGWPVKDDDKAAVVKSLRWLVDNSKDARAKGRAAMALLAIDKHNLEILKAQQPQRLDITTGGQPLRDLSALTPEQIQARIVELDRLALPPG
jgi:hypothetical protein